MGSNYTKEAIRFHHNSSTNPCYREFPELTWNGDNVGGNELYDMICAMVNNGGPLRMTALPHPVG